MKRLLRGFRDLKWQRVPNSDKYVSAQSAMGAGKLTLPTADTVCQPVKPRYWKPKRIERGRRVAHP